MKVELAAITKPSIDTTAAGFVAYAARVSNPANQMNEETAPRLLAYLRSKGHWSPFEMAHAVLYIETTRDIGRQILRHRSFSFQEFSQRYAKVEDFETSNARRQDTTNRQNSIDDLDPSLQREWRDIQQSTIAIAQDAYERALAAGVAKECARKILPEGLTVSKMFMSGSFRSWLHYLEQRTNPATQLEHREVALEVQRVLREAAPEVFK